MGPISSVGHQREDTDCATHHKAKRRHTDSAKQSGEPRYNRMWGERPQVVRALSNQWPLAESCLIVSLSMSDPRKLLYVDLLVVCKPKICC